MMRKIWTIARHEYLVNVRRPGFIIMTALVPVLGGLLLVMTAFFGGQAAAFLERHFAPTPQQIGVMDNLGAFTPILPAYQERYHLFADEEAGRAALQAGEITILLIIPRDYVASGRVKIISRESGFSVAALGDSAALRAFFVEHLVRDKLDPALHRRLADPIEPVLVSLEGEGGRGGPLGVAFNFLLPFFLSILLVMTIFVSSGYLLQGVAEEKTSRVSRSFSPRSRRGSFWPARSSGWGRWD